MTARVKLPALPVEGTDTSAAIVSLLGTMPREHQAELLATLQPQAVRLRWLEPQDAAQVIAILPELAGEAQSLVENRLLPPWMRRARRHTERDNAIRAAAALYTEHRTGRGHRPGDRRALPAPAAAARSAPGGNRAHPGREPGQGAGVHDDPKCARRHAARPGQKSVIAFGQGRGFDFLQKPLNQQNKNR